MRNFSIVRSSFAALILATATITALQAATFSGSDTPDWTASMLPPTTTKGGYDAVETSDTHELVMGFWKVASVLDPHAMRSQADALVTSFGPDVAAYRGAAIVVRFFGTARDAKGNVKTASFAYVANGAGWKRATARARISQLILLGL